jgi:hypothetical protein
MYNDMCDIYTLSASALLRSFENDIQAVQGDFEGVLE